MLRIASFAAIAGVSAKVLRDYDEAGIFQPAWVDPRSGYRLYSPAQLPILRRVIALRELGVGLSTIHRLVADNDDLGRVLRERREQLRRQHREVERQLALLDVQLDDETGVVVRRLEPQRIATATVASYGGDVGRAFYELEKQVQRTGTRAPMPPGLVNDRRAGTFVYVPVRSLRQPAMTTSVLPDCRAATIVHAGGYRGLDAARRKLRGWMRRAGYERAGPERVVYLRFSAEPDLTLRRDFLVASDEEFLTEIQLPLAAG